MSYILDALKRADAQRQQGAATPGLNLLQEPVPLGSLPAEPADSAKSRNSLPMVLGVAATLLVAGVGYWLWSRPATEQIALAAVPQPAASQAAITPHKVRPVAPPPAKPVQPKPVPKAVSVTAAASAPLPFPLPTRVPSTVAPSPSVPEKPISATVQIKASEPAVTTETAPALVAHDTPKLSEMPDATRRQVPKLTVTGSVYSDNPAQRLLVVNGQVLTQGSQIAPELRLEEIGEKSSVFSFAGTRFRVPH